MQRPLLYYEVHGKQGPYLLLVHGIMSSRAQWAPNVETLSAFCRPVIVELFGHGRSPSPEDPEYYTPDNYVLEFERIRYQLDAERWFLCGQSLGASLTLRYGLYHPEYTIAQIFTNSRSALSDNPPEDMMKALAKRLEEEGSSMLHNFPLHPSKSRHLKPEIKDALVEDVNLINVEGFARMMVHMVPKCSVRATINKNQVPTLLIVGRFDKQFKSLLGFAKETIPRLEVLVLDGGHAINIDAPEEFNHAVEEYISRFM